MDVRAWLYPFLGILLRFALLRNVECQGGGGLAVGLGLGADMMMDTALGEMPNPLFLGTGGVNAPIGGGGGFNSGGLFSLFGPDPGVTNGPFLSGHLGPSDTVGTLGPTTSQGSVFFSDANTLPRFRDLNSAASSFNSQNTAGSLSVHTGEPFVMQNEAFTALGSIGQAHRVRSPETVPSTTPKPAQAPAFNPQSSPSLDASMSLTVDAASGSTGRITDLDDLRRAIMRSARTSPTASRDGASSGGISNLDTLRQALIRSSAGEDASTRRRNSIESLRQALVRAVMNTGRAMGSMSGNASDTSKTQTNSVTTTKSESQSVPIPMNTMGNSRPQQTSQKTDAQVIKTHPSESTSPKQSVASETPHLEDLTASGLYPFEGSFAAKDALLSQSTSVINDLNKAMQASATGSEVLHLENPFRDTVVLSSSNGAPITNFEGIRLQKRPGSGLSISSSVSGTSLQHGQTQRGASTVFDANKSNTQTVISDANSVLYQTNGDIGSVNGGGITIGLGVQPQYISKQTLTDSRNSNPIASKRYVDINKNIDPQSFLTNKDNTFLGTVPSSTTKFSNEQRAVHINPEWVVKGFSVLPNSDSPGFPATISDLSKVVDLTSSGSDPHMLTTEQAVPVRTSSSDSSKQPFVGKIFGDSSGSQTGAPSSELNRTGASVDFISTFFNHAGSQGDLNVVPLDQTSVENINMAQAKAKADAASVDQFGVADIYTRSQKLDPTQWKNFLSSVSDNDSKVGSHTFVDYQTQNVVGAGETRALNSDSGSINSIENQLNKLVILQQAQQDLLMQRGLSNEAARDPTSIRTTFEAPGMVEQSAVRIGGPNSVSSKSTSGVVDLGTQTMKEFSNTRTNTQVDRLPPGTGSGSFSLGQSVLVQDGGSPLKALTSTSLNELASNGLRLGQPIMMSETNVRDLLSGRMSVDNTVRDAARTGGVQTSSFKASDIMNSFGGNQDPAFLSGSRMAMFGAVGGNTNTVSTRVMSGGSHSSGGSGLVDPLASPKVCNYMADPKSSHHFLMRIGVKEYRLRCALGTAFDAATCECSTRVLVSEDCLEVHMDFNNGVVEDSSINKLPIGNENVEVTNKSTPLTGIALFGGDSKLTIWRYQNYDFRDHVLIKIQFRPGPGGDRYQPLLSNCDGGLDGPSIGIIYDSLTAEVKLHLQTDNDTKKELSFSVNPDEWNDVTYIYDGQEFIGIVNGVRRYVSRQDPHLLGIIGGEIKSLPTQGLIEIRDAAIVLGHCPRFGYFRGAMVDIQVYTCIPKDFRLE